ncbi:MAG: OB-fold domain-containing protein [Myxococcota bacterium]
MIASLRGKLLHKDAEGAVIECGGVGYGVAMSLSGLTQLGAESAGARVCLYARRRRRLAPLWFYRRQSAGVSCILLSASGVGPRLALAVLSTFSPSELAAVVARRDIGTFGEDPGVGKRKRSGSCLCLAIAPRPRGAEVSVSQPGTQAGDSQSALETSASKRRLPNGRQSRLLHYIRRRKIWRSLCERRCA